MCAYMRTYTNSKLEREVCVCVCYKIIAHIQILSTLFYKTKKLTEKRKDGNHTPFHRMKLFLCCF